MFWFSVACTGASDIDTEVVDTDVDTDPDTEAPQLTDAQQGAILDAITKDLKKTANRGASAVQVAIWLDGSVVFEAGVGSADPSSEVEVGTERLFQIGSDTKKLTALAALQQEAAGTLSLDDAVSSAIPGFALAATPGWADATTLHHLASHQGGLYDYTPWDDAPSDDTLHDRAFDVLAADGWAHSPGGAMWNYSNPNFSLLGLATEVATDRAWADVVEDDLFAPLGLTRTFARESEVAADGLYAIGRGYVQEAPPADPFRTWADSGTYKLADTDLADVADNGFTRPAGLVWSTAGDMARLGGFLIDGDPDVLDDVRVASLHTPYVRLYPALEGQAYGYGLFVVDGVNTARGFHPGEVWLHGGNTLSFTSTFYVFPEQRMAISVLSNGYGNDFGATVAAAYDAVFPDAPVAEPDPLPMTETDHAKLVGHYEDPGLGVIEIGEDDGVLTIDIPYLEKTLGVSVGPTLKLALTDVYTVNIAGSPFDFTFVADEAGEYRWIRNRIAVGTRVAAATSRGPRAPRPPAQLLVDVAEQRQMATWAAPFRQR